MLINIRQCRNSVDNRHGNKTVLLNTLTKLGEQWRDGWLVGRQSSTATFKPQGYHCSCYMWSPSSRHHDQRYFNQFFSYSVTEEKKFYFSSEEQNGRKKKKVEIKTSINVLPSGRSKTVDCWLPSNKET